MGYASELLVDLCCFIIRIVSIVHEATKLPTQPQDSFRKETDSLNSCFGATPILCQQTIIMSKLLLWVLKMSIDLGVGSHSVTGHDI